MSFRHFAEQCVMNNDRSSSCANAEAIVQPSLENCDCAKQIRETAAEQCGGGGSYFPQENPSAKAKSCSQNTATPGHSAGRLVDRSEIQPMIPEYPMGAQLSTEVTSRDFDYSGPVQSRAVCGYYETDVHTCVFYRKEELGKASCTHPRACDPVIFNDPRLTIVSLFLNFTQIELLILIYGWY